FAVTLLGERGAAAAGAGLLGAAGAEPPRGRWRGLGRLRYSAAHKVVPARLAVPVVLVNGRVTVRAPHHTSVLGRTELARSTNASRSGPSCSRLASSR